MPKNTAVLIDGGFFCKRLSTIYGEDKSMDAEFATEKLYKVVSNYTKLDKRHDAELYRIFFYDCPPLLKKVHHPVSKDIYDFSTSGMARFRGELHKRLVTYRKVALRLGFLNEAYADWRIKKSVQKEILKGKKSYSTLADGDFQYDTQQKQIDMKIGLDIAALSYKQLVSQIVLISGDSDFVPAAKIARREGIDFILDPMWANIQPDLYEHVDGIKNEFPRPKHLPENIVHMKAG